MLYHLYGPILSDIERIKYSDYKDSETSQDIAEAISLKGGRYLEAQIQGSKDLLIHEVSDLVWSFYV